MSLTLLGILNEQASGLSPFWLGVLNQDSSAKSVNTDSVGNIYAVGSAVIAGETDMQIIKYDALGVIQWQRRLGASAVSDTATSVNIDSSDNIYFTGADFTRGVFVAKYNSSGTIQWQRNLDQPYNLNNSALGITSSGDVYLAYEMKAADNRSDIGIAKYNTSGTLQWQRKLGNSGINNNFYTGLVVDSSGNSYLNSSSFDGSTRFNFTIAKYNSSGTIQWQRELGASENNIGYGAALDSSDNPYVVGRTTLTGNPVFQIAKYNTSGTLQWQRKLSGTTQDEARSASADTSGNLYVAGFSVISGKTGIQVAKYNSSGVIQWQRRLSNPAYIEAVGIFADSDDTYYLAGNSNSGSGSRFFISKLPNDGSLTGTYTVESQDNTYAASSLTDAAGTLTSSTSTITETAGSLTATTSSLTDSSTSLTWSRSS
jgi:hypothetical protein